MDKLLSFTPEPFPELDREAEYDELDPLAGEWEAEEAEEEVRRGRRPRLSAKAPQRFVRKPTLRPRVPSRATGPRVKPLRQLPKLMPRPLPVPALRPVPIPFIPPQWGLRPDVEPAPPRDSQLPEESRRPEHAGYEGSGSPPSAQPPEEPASEHVRWVQDCLNRALGLQLTVDGVMNRETRSAVRMFQERRGLTITGLVGPDTEAALQSTCAGAPPPATDHAVIPEAESEIPRPASCACPACNRRETMKYQLKSETEPFGGSTFEPWQSEINSDSPPRVRWIQESLNKILGLKLTVDGIMGQQTRSAIRTFQQRQGLVVDGIVGPSTEAKMRQLLKANTTTPGSPSDGPSATRRRFENAVAQGNWREAFLNLNGLNMYEMLHALDVLSLTSRENLKSKRQQYRKGGIHFAPV